MKKDDDEEYSSRKITEKTIVEKSHFYSKHGRRKQEKSLFLILISTLHFNEKRKLCIQSYFEILGKIFLLL